VKTDPLKLIDKEEKEEVEKDKRKVNRTKCRHEGQVVKFSLRVTKSLFSLSLFFTIPFTYKLSQ